MKQRQQGFTLIELLIVIAIIGIIAAIAMPNMLNAIDRARQKRSMADVRSIGAACERYQVDNAHYPTGDTVAILEAALQPTYIQVMPLFDGWGNDWIVDGETDGSALKLASGGKDDIAEGTPVGGRTNDFDCDIIWTNGAFTQWPEGMQE